MTDASDRRADVRARIVEVAAQLLGEGGPAAVTTRGVAEAAGVQAPTIYRLFGDKDGLLDAVAEHVMAASVSAKRVTADAEAADGGDPVEVFRRAWHQQIEFGVANPGVFRLLSDPARAAQSPAARAGRQVLEGRVHRIAAAGRLRVGEGRAADLVQAAGLGVITTLLATPPELRDAGLADAMLEAVLRQVLTDGPASPGGGPAAAAVALRAAVPTLGALSRPEQHLLAEWLDRVVDAS